MAVLLSVARSPLLVVCTYKIEQSADATCTVLFVFRTAMARSISGMWFQISQASYRGIELERVLVFLLLGACLIFLEVFKHPPWCLFLLEEKV